MSTQRDYYEILGVPKSATLDEIKKAYREAALKHHPDRVPENQKKEAEERFKEISEAYAILSDAQKRALYDQRGHAGIDQQYTYEDIFKGADFSTVFQDLSDFGLGESLFEHIFGDSGFDYFGRSRKQRSQAHDLQITVDISLEEAATGVEKVITFPRYDLCSQCKGSGAKEGRIATTPCPECHGEGRVKVHRKLAVNIPPGVDTGSQLRVRNEGENGQGDLYVVIEVRPHPLFRREGANLILEKSISLSQAVLGGEIEVPILFGKVKMKIPAGTPSGKIFRLKEKGMPKLRSIQKGDEFVHIHVKIPTSLTPEQKRLMEAFAKASGEIL